MVCHSVANVAFVVTVAAGVACGHVVVVSGFASVNAVAVIEIASVDVEGVVTVNVNVDPAVFEHAELAAFVYVVIVVRGVASAADVVD